MLQFFGGRQIPLFLDRYPSSGYLISSLTNSRGSRVAGPKSRSRVQSRGRGSNVAAGENDLEFEVTE